MPSSAVGFRALRRLVCYRCVLSVLVLWLPEGCMCAPFPPCRIKGGSTPFVERCGTLPSDVFCSYLSLDHRQRMRSQSLLLVVPLVVFLLSGAGGNGSHRRGTDALRRGYRVQRPPQHQRRGQASRSRWRRRVSVPRHPFVRLMHDDRAACYPPGQLCDSCRFDTRCTLPESNPQRRYTQRSPTAFFLINISV